MHYPRPLTILEKMVEDIPYNSLGDDATFLRIFKQHCALPAAETWTERDDFLKGLIDSAELQIDDWTGQPYRPRTYTLKLNKGPDRCCAGVRSIGLPVFPIDETPTITWTDNDGNTGDLVEGTDFSFDGGRSIAPVLTFLSGITWPTTNNVPFPYKLTILTAADKENLLQTTAIHQLGAYYFRNPEAMGQEVPNMGQGFWGVITSLKGKFL